MRVILLDLIRHGTMQAVVVDCESDPSTPGHAQNPRDLSSLRAKQLGVHARVSSFEERLVPANHLT